MNPVVNTPVENSQRDWNQAAIDTTPVDASADTPLRPQENMLPSISCEKIFSLFNSLDRIILRSMLEYLEKLGPVFNSKLEQLIHRSNLAAGERNWREAARLLSLAFESVTYAHFRKDNLSGDLQQYLSACFFGAANDALLLYGKMDVFIDADGKPSGILKYGIPELLDKRFALPMYFEPDQSSLTFSGQESIEALASYILHQRPVKKLILKVYYDQRGSQEYLKLLSEKRGAAIVAYLEKYQVGEHIEIQGAEWCYPESYFSNLSDIEERNLCHRVDVQLYR